jgi:hypothetical protein
LLQSNDFERRKLDRQFLQVVQRGAAPAVDGLVVVAHRGEAGLIGRVAAHQQLEHFVLGGVGVLVLVHQHMAHQALPLAPYLRVVAQQLQRQADQVVKIHALVGGQAFFVTRHHGGGNAGAVVFGLRQGLFGVHARAFPAADGPLHLAGSGCIHGAAGILENAGDVVTVQNTELGFEPQRRAVQPQHAHAQGVEGAYHHVLGGPANQPFGALAHFSGGLVGKGDGGNALRRHAGLDQAANLVGDHPGFTRARPGQHQAGAVQVVNGFKLGRVQTVGGWGRHAGGNGNRDRIRRDRFRGNTGFMPPTKAAILTAAAGRARNALTIPQCYKS